MYDDPATLTRVVLSHSLFNSVQENVQYTILTLPEMSAIANL